MGRVGNKKIKIKITKQIKCLKSNPKKCKRSKAGKGNHIMAKAANERTKITKRSWDLPAIVSKWKLLQPAHSYIKPSIYLYFQGGDSGSHYCPQGHTCLAGLWSQPGMARGASWLLALVIMIPGMQALVVPLLYTASLLAGNTSKYWDDYRGGSAFCKVTKWQT